MLGGMGFECGTPLGTAQEKPLPIGANLLEDLGEKRNEQSEQKAGEKFKDGTGYPKGKPENETIRLGKGRGEWERDWLGPGTHIQPTFKAKSATPGTEFKK
jgi:hypothetical protein